MRYNVKIQTGFHCDLLNGGLPGDDNKKQGKAVRETNSNNVIHKIRPFADEPTATRKNHQNTA